MYPPAIRQRALVEIDRGLSISAVSRKLDVSRATLRAWRDRRDQRPDGECPLCDGAPLSNSAYAALLGYYLGDGHLTHAERYSTLRVTCDRAYPMVTADVTQVILGVRPAARVYEVTHGSGVVNVTAHWRHWECLIPQHGPGKKSTRRIRLTPWQHDAVRASTADFLRGLFFSDGTRFTNGVTRRVGNDVRRYEYPRWQFTNTSPDIIDLCTDALDMLSVPWRRSGETKVSVSRRGAVARLDALIGTRAPLPSGAHTGNRDGSRTG